MSVSSSLSRTRRWLERDQPIWVCLLPGLLLLPFLGKAFHIDDTQFLIHARLIAEHPLDPYVQVFEWDSMRVAIIDFPHPLFWQYGLAGLRALFGESEVALHGLTFCFGLLALRGMRGLALRLGVPPLAACALLAGSCGFLVMGSTVMPDLAAMALSVAALDRLVAAVEDGEPADGAWAGVFAACAFLTRFTAVITIVFLLVYPILRRRWRPGVTAALGIALAAVGISELWSAAQAGRPHFWSSLFRWSSASSVVRDLHFTFNELVFLGAQLPITGLALFAIGARNRSAWIGVVGGAVAVTALVAALSPERGFWLAALIFAWPGASLVADALGRLVSGARQRFAATDTRTALRWMLSLWLIATTFATVRYEHVAVKYLLLPLPAAVLLVLDGLSEMRGWRRRAGAVLLWTSCVVGATTGFAVALSDYRWANMYRDFIDERFADHPVPSGARYYNAQWGLRYYAERAGLRPYRGGVLRPGDELLVSALVPPNWEMARMPQGVVAQYELHYPGPFALLGFEHQAGFYSNHWGVYPFAPASEVRDTILVLREVQRHRPQ